jgi:hypothetical protein
MVMNSLRLARCEGVRGGILSLGLPATADFESLSSRGLDGVEMAEYR